MLINRHSIDTTEPLAPYVNHVGRLVTRYAVIYDNGMRQTYEQQSGGGPILVRTEMPPRCGLPHPRAGDLNPREGVDLEG
jgi:hypothetical protein